METTRKTRKNKAPESDESGHKIFLGMGFGYFKASIAEITFSGTFCERK